jgi:dienelactone hydrolase
MKMHQSNWRPFLKKATLFLSVMTLGTGLLALNHAFAKAGPSRMSNEAGLRIVIDPADHIFGTPFSITVAGLKPGEQATIKARSTDAAGISWESHAVFSADDKGMVDVARQAPLSGDYADADILGLLWSMKSLTPEGQRLAPYSHDRDDGLIVHFTVADSEEHTASARLRRHYHMPGAGLIRVPLEQDGLHGFMYSPATAGPFPGVIILGGSNGGLYEWLAQAFASNGFAALTLAYFNYKDLPRELVEIPLEPFQRAVSWMKAQKVVKVGSLGLVGGSKGAEVALLLAASNDDFKSVVAWVPSGYVWQGISMDMKPVSSWSLNGQGLPWIGGVVTPEDIAKYERGEVDSVRQFYALGLEQADPTTIERARIPVEKIKAPILLVSGTDDQTWPSAEFSDTIMQWLEKNKHPYEHKHVRWEGAGHMVFLPQLITGQNRMMNGGNARDDARGGLASWNETIAFLHKHLDR